MTPFMTEDFLLDTEFARRLYHDYAKDQPIFDYHCHLPPQQIADGAGMATFLRTLGGSFAASLTTWIWIRRADQHHAYIS